jgi:hypothetical protein
VSAAGTTAGAGPVGTCSSVIPASSGSLATSASWRSEVSAVYDVRRHPLSSVRSNVRTASSPPVISVAAHTAPVPPVHRSTLIVPGAASAIARTRSTTCCSLGAVASDDPSDANNNRASGDSRLPYELAHHTTA